MFSVAAYLERYSGGSEYISLYGYLAIDNESLFLYENESFFRFKSLEAKQFRLRVYMPNSLVDSNCLNKMVGIYGTSYYYLGEVVLDEVVRIVGLSDGYNCYSEPSPVTVSKNQ